MLVISRFSFKQLSTFSGLEQMSAKPAAMDLPATNLITQGWSL
ncbi:hypothetical protein RvVAR031_pl00910 (plasmid) [Agrobacterium vitis]|nr:hypothetical protein RvVAR031_pl00910 [Agrobacterium vitis]